MAINMDEPIESIKTFFRDRTSSPLGGAFAVAWVIWNYKVVLILISSIPLRNKFAMISEQFSEWDYCIEAWPILGSGEAIAGLLIPGAIAFSYLIFYPIFAIPAYALSLLFQSGMKWVRLKNDGLKPISRAEARALNNRINVDEAKNQQELEDRDNKIKDLQKTLVDLESDLTTEKEKVQQAMLETKPMATKMTELEALNDQQKESLKQASTEMTEKKEELRKLTNQLKNAKETLDAKIAKSEILNPALPRASDSNEVRLMLSNFSNLPYGDFSLSDIVGETIWPSIGAETKASLAQQFRDLIVDRTLPVVLVGTVDDEPLFEKRKTE